MNGRGDRGERGEEPDPYASIRVRICSLFIVFIAETVDGFRWVRLGEEFCGKIRAIGSPIDLNVIISFKKK